MTFGQLTIEKLREIGTFVDNDKRPRQALDACARIEDIMLRINDRRKRLEVAWDDRKSQLDLSQQACQLIAELQQIEDWINRNGDALHRDKDLGDSETTADHLLREHEQLFNDAKVSNGTLKHKVSEPLIPVSDRKQPNVQSQGWESALVTANPTLHAFRRLLALLMLLCAGVFLYADAVIWIWTRFHD